ncbi:MAG: UDP-N-acetylmuramoyl-tripeptide--D-alanyl-D-alanine ligase [Paracoccaceae bacterium]
MTAPLWTSPALAAATGARLTRPFAATGISIDTRSLAPGDLFVALTAIRDGHDFVAGALANGAAAALVSRLPEGLPPDAPLALVPDVLAALRSLAAAARARTAAKAVGVTGSVGKTSTKEMLRAILSGQGATHAAEASFNNHWGVPLTLARMPEAIRFAVLEIGMNRPGEIAPLARLARLDAALVTTVAPAHLEAFESLEGIAHEKASIYEGLLPGGTAIVPLGLPTTPILTARARATAARVLTFGRDEAADFRLIDATLAEGATVVRATRFGEPMLLRLLTPGAHFAMNALAALAAAEALGADPALAALDLGRWQPPDGRGKRDTVRLDIVDESLAFDLIDDAFNANPASVAAALDVLAAARPKDGVGRRAEGRRIAILGDMLELGATELALHRALAEHPAMAQVHLVHCLGPRMRALWEVLPAGKRGEWHETAEGLAARAASLADAGDVILVKGSKGSKASLVAGALRRLGRPGASGIGVAE